MRVLFAALLLLVGGLSMAEAQMAQPVAALPIVQHWVRFVDPQEMAFQVELPQGWQNSGGTARRNALQFRTWVASKSLDGLTIVAINDPREWSYIAPSPLLAAAGFRMGGLYNGGRGTVYTIAPRQSGQQYSASWGCAGWPNCVVARTSSTADPGPTLPGESISTHARLALFTMSARRLLSARKTIWR